MNKTFGFTLAELLIALAILGEIATFTIPKILSAQQNGQKKTVMRETVATMMAILHQGRITGNVQSALDSTYIINNINAIKICSSNSTTEGCWTQGGMSSEVDEAGALLPNGATIAGFNNPSSSGNGIAMDWNGAAGPNLDGDDQLDLYMCVGPSNCGSRRPGTITPDSAASTTLFESIFSN